MSIQDPKIRVLVDKHKSSLVDKLGQFEATLKLNIIITDILKRDPHHKQVSDQGLCFYYDENRKIVEKLITNKTNQILVDRLDYFTMNVLETGPIQTEENN